MVVCLLGECDGRWRSEYFWEREGGRALGGVKVGSGRIAGRVLLYVRF